MSVPSLTTLMPARVWRVRSWWWGGEEGGSLSQPRRARLRIYLYPRFHRQGRCKSAALLTARRRTPVRIVRLELPAPGAEQTIINEVFHPARRASCRPSTAASFALRRAQPRPHPGRAAARCRPRAWCSARQRHRRACGAFVPPPACAALAAERCRSRGAGLDHRSGWRTALPNVLSPLCFDLPPPCPARSPPPTPSWRSTCCITRPGRARRALFAGAAAVVPEGGVVVCYGPYRRGGAHTAPSNADFDEWLRSVDARFAVRDLEAVETEARVMASGWRRWSTCRRTTSAWSSVTVGARRARMMCAPAHRRQSMLPRFTP